VVNGVRLLTAIVETLINEIPSVRLPNPTILKIEILVYDAKKKKKKNEILSKLAAARVRRPRP